MIERVARALCVLDRRDPDSDRNSDGRDGPWQTEVLYPEGMDRKWYDYVSASRAAIAAMREPTEEMCSAGDPFSLNADYPGGNYSATCWREMIDEALK